MSLCVSVAMSQTVDQEDSAQEQRHVEKELERLRKHHDDLRTKSAR